VDSEDVFKMKENLDYLNIFTRPSMPFNFRKNDLKLEEVGDVKKVIKEYINHGVELSEDLMNYINDANIMDYFISTKNISPIEYLSIKENYYDIKRRVSLIEFLK